MSSDETARKVIEKVAKRCSCYMKFTAAVFIEPPLLPPPTHTMYIAVLLLSVEQPPGNQSQQIKSIFHCICEPTNLSPSIIIVVYRCTQRIALFICSYLSCLSTNKEGSSCLTTTFMFSDMEA